MVSTTLNIATSIQEPFDVRAVRREEADAMLDLMCRCFGLDSASARRIFYSDPFFSLKMKRVLVGSKSARLISSMTLVPAVLRISPAETLQLCGIAGVCTDPELRGQGYASALIERTLIDAYDELGFELCALTADRPDLYEHLGWAVCGTGIEWSAPSSALPRYAEGEFVRELRAEDMNANRGVIHKLYAASWGNVEVGAFVRDTRRWQCIEKLSTGRRVGVFERDGVVAGYCDYELRPADGGRLVFVREMLADDSVARRALIGYFARGKLGEVVAGQCSQTDAAALGLLSTPGVVLRAKPNVYMRLTHVFGLLQRILAHVPPPPELTRFPGGLAIRVRPRAGIVAGADGVAGRHVALVRAAGRKVQILPVAGSGIEHGIEGDAGAVTQMLIGFQTASELVSAGRLAISTNGNGIASACDALFPRLQPYLAAPDVF
jgi:predicted acetyltransferase